MNRIHCPYCHCSRNVKYGTNNTGKQRYWCQNPACGKIWVRKRSLPAEQIWNEFVWSKLSVKSLARIYHCHPNTIRNIIHEYAGGIDARVRLDKLSNKEKEEATVIAMDATYFGRGYCVIVIIDANSGRLLYFQEKEGSETILAFEAAILTLLQAGIHPKACIVDGRMGVKKMLEEYGILVQHCLFHIQLLANQCLTRSPVLTPNRELRNIVGMLCASGHHLNREQFMLVFFNWRANNLTWLNEKYRDESGKLVYSHPKTRRLVQSMVRDYEYYFTYEKYPELSIPRTSGRIEGLFGWTKSSLNNHRGYTKQLRSRIFLLCSLVDQGRKSTKIVVNP